MSIHLSTERRTELLSRLRDAYSKEFDENLSDFRAELLLDLVLQAVGPSIYNQGVQDAQAFMQSRLDDLNGELEVTIG